MATNPQPQLDSSTDSVANSNDESPAMETENYDEGHPGVEDNNHQNSIHLETRDNQHFNNVDNQVDHTNKNTIPVSSDVPSSVENKSSTGNQDKTDVSDTTDQFPTTSDHEESMHVDENNIDTTQTHSSATQEANSVTGNSDGSVDNISVEPVSLQTGQILSASSISANQAQEDMTNLRNNDLIDHEQIQLNLENDNRQNDDATLPAQVLVENYDQKIKSEPNNVETNRIGTLGPIHQTGGKISAPHSDNKLVPDEGTSPPPLFEGYGPYIRANQNEKRIKEASDFYRTYPPSENKWFDLQFHDADPRNIKKPNEIEKDMDEPFGSIDAAILDRIQGSMVGMAIGDALGAHVEFRPHQYLASNPVKDLEGGGTWGLEKGQFTDDTSMALCLANSLITCQGYNPYDQLVRYKWWYKYGYMSSTGHCFDIGAATRNSIVEFEHRQKQLAKESNLKLEDMDFPSNSEVLKDFDVYCSEEEVAGNGALMRLAPVPLFFFKEPQIAVEYSGRSGQITHGDQKAYDACRYYGALIVAALQGETKDQILNNNFYEEKREKHWFGNKELHKDIKDIAKGSYKKKDGYDGGIRGKGYIVKALEAALWAFWSDDQSFEKGALAAVNLGDDTDTTAAIYGQLAGAYYGYQNLPKNWLQHVYAKTFLEKLSKWIAYEGECWHQNYKPSINQAEEGSH